MNLVLFFYLKKSLYIKLQTNKEKIKTGYTPRAHSGFVIAYILTLTWLWRNQYESRQQHEPVFQPSNLSEGTKLEKVKPFDLHIFSLLFLFFSLFLFHGLGSWSCVCFVFPSLQLRASPCETEKTRLLENKNKNKGSL